MINFNEQLRNDNLHCRCFTMSPPIKCHCFNSFKCRSTDGLPGLGLGTNLKGKSDMEKIIDLVDKEDYALFLSALDKQFSD